MSIDQFLGTLTLHHYLSELIDKHAMLRFNRSLASRSEAELVSVVSAIVQQPSVILADVPGILGGMYRSFSQFIRAAERYGGLGNQEFYNGTRVINDPFVRSYITTASLNPVDSRAIEDVIRIKDSIPGKIRDPDFMDIVSALGSGIRIRWRINDLVRLPTSVLNRYPSNTYETFLNSLSAAPAAAAVPFYICCSDGIYLVIQSPNALAETQYNIALHNDFPSVIVTNASIKYVDIVDGCTTTGTVIPRRMVANDPIPTVAFNGVNRYNINSGSINSLRLGAQVTINTQVAPAGNRVIIKISGDFTVGPDYFAKLVSGPPDDESIPYLSGFNSFLDSCLRGTISPPLGCGENEDVAQMDVAYHNLYRAMLIEKGVANGLPLLQSHFWEHSKLINVVFGQNPPAGLDGDAKRDICRRMLAISVIFCGLNRYSKIA